jgi:hypothetical protein
VQVKFLKGTSQLDDAMKNIPAAVLQLSIAGPNVNGPTLGHEIRSCGKTLLVFLRHFG